MNKETEKKVKELESTLEYEEMQLDISEKYPTYTAQFMSGMQKSRERVYKLREELKKLKNNIN